MVASAGAAEERERIQRQSLAAANQARNNQSSPALIGQLDVHKETTDLQALIAQLQKAQLSEKQLGEVRQRLIEQQGFRSVATAQPAPKPGKKT